MAIETLTPLLVDFREFIFVIFLSCLTIRLPPSIYELHNPEEDETTKNHWHQLEASIWVISKPKNFKCYESPNSNTEEKYNW